MNVDNELFAAHPSIDVSVDFNDIDSDELLVRPCDVREGVSPQLGDVLVAGDWGARPAKVQVIEITAAWVRLRVLD
ncbi:MAG: hypothetical protein ACKO2Q_10505 [Actinomycetota bacterium]